ncbi:MAG: Brp/Blh family beta-carotene 15,15'-dioxygenase [Candidatus Puniceispirillaceae bacterium]
MNLLPLDWLSLAAILMIGLPHGAFDAAIYALVPAKDKTHIPKKSKSRNTARLLSFLISYIAVAVLVVYLWIALPVLSLVAFLAFSCFHFGKADSAAITGKIRIAAIISHGGLVTILIPLFHPEATSDFFVALSGFYAKDIITFMPVMGVIWALSFGLYAKKGFKDKATRPFIIEVFLLAFAMAFLPVLPAFALYFCGVHSRRHFITLYQEFKQCRPQSVLPMAMGLTFASWLAAAIGIWALMPYLGIVIAAIQIIFIGLAALTVPHMILVDGLWRPLAIQKANKP